MKEGLWVAIYDVWKGGLYKNHEPTVLFWQLSVEDLAVYNFILQNLWLLTLDTLDGGQSLKTKCLYI